MSELLFYLTPTRATVPITSRGNVLWRGSERFLVKGICYNPRTSGGYSTGSSLDPLTADRLDDIQQDIHLLHDLGLNTISVHGLEPSVNHSQALKLLEKEGIYVLVSIFGDLKAPPREDSDAVSPQRGPQAAQPCPPHILARNLKLVDNLSGYPNILGFIVSGSPAFKPQMTRMASLVRTCIRDTKTFVRFRNHRPVLVGVGAPDILMPRFCFLQYIAAGEPMDRADFFAMQCYSWAGPSSFSISGWKNTCEAYSRVPIPMILSEYGTAIHKPRVWDEVECLYSPDMTGVFSGGCLYAYFEHGNGYGLVKVDASGRRLPKRGEMRSLRKRFRIVNQRTEDEVLAEGMKDYEGWRGDFPPVNGQLWDARQDEIPAAQADWDSILETFQEAGTNII